jgi:hypothetical protein
MNTQQLNELRMQAVKSGDWTKYTQALDANAHTPHADAYEANKRKASAPDNAQEKIPFIGTVDEKLPTPSYDGAFTNAQAKASAPHNAQGMSLDDAARHTCFCSRCQAELAASAPDNAQEETPHQLRQRAHAREWDANEASAQPENVRDYSKMWSNDAYQTLLAQRDELLAAAKDALDRIEWEIARINADNYAAPVALINTEEKLRNAIQRCNSEKGGGK